MVRGGSARAGGSGSATSRAGPPRESVPNLDASGGRRWKVAIAARPPLFSESLAATLVQQTNVEIAGRASEETDVLELVRRTRPAVLLLDEDGFGPSAGPLIRSLHRCAPGTRVLVLSAESNDGAVERVLRTGASGLVGKQESVATLRRAIQAVVAGELWANRRATAHVIEVLSGPAGGASAAREHLTSREWEIADAVGRGLRNKEIARRLKVSEKTVKSHLNNIFRKLQVDNRFAVGLYTLDRPGPGA